MTTTIMINPVEHVYSVNTFSSERTDFRPGRADLRPERADSRPERQISGLRG